jgi:membrane associated rhomboid family serine protease
MFGNEFSEDQRPLTYLGGYPIHAATLIVVVYVVSLIITSLLMASGQSVVGEWLMFDSHLATGGAQIWRFFTYGLWNPPSINFVVNMFIIVWFGRELERFFGRKIFLRFYGMLYFLQPVLYALLGLLFGRQQIFGETGAFALFIAFATLYPNVALLFNILAKWLAVILVGIYSLMALADRQIVPLITLWAAVGFAYAFVRHEQGRWSLPKINFVRRPKFRVVPKAETTAKSSASNSDDDDQSDMDALLDKIARSGMSSLTAKERARLEQAREALLRKDKR